MVDSDTLVVKRHSVTLNRIKVEGYLTYLQLQLEDP